MSANRRLRARCKVFCFSFWCGTELICTRARRPSQLPPRLFSPWALCPEAFYSSPRLSLLPFSDFGSPQCPHCAAHLHRLVPWGCARVRLQSPLCVSLLSAVCLKTLFFPLFLCSCRFAALRGASRSTSLAALLISGLVRVCSCSFCCRELFSKHSRGHGHRDSSGFLLHPAPEEMPEK